MTDVVLLYDTFGALCMASSSPGERNCGIGERLFVDPAAS